jgi:hypothetical protein
LHKLFSANILKGSASIGQEGPLDSVAVAIACRYQTTGFFLCKFYLLAVAETFRAADFILYSPWRNRNVWNLFETGLLHGVSAL